MSDTLDRLHEVLLSRKGAAKEDSYVAGLYHKGLNRILEKVGEESVETLLAARDAETMGDNTALVSETADLWFHCMVMLAYMGSGPEEVLEELDKRFGLSGLEEKASRPSGG